VVVDLLNAIYERDFLGCSYGFRPGRGQHQALDEVGRVICTRPMGWVLEIDIRSYLDSYSQCSYGSSKRPGGGSTTLIRKPLRFPCRT
jgi:hypothetical protein